MVSFRNADGVTTRSSRFVCTCVFLTSSGSFLFLASPLSSDRSESSSYTPVSGRPSVDLNESGSKECYSE